MSLEDESDYWSSSGVRPFNFDEDDLSPNITGISQSGKSESLKTVESILAAKPSSNEPFLKPSMIVCNGNKIEQLIEYLDNLNPQLKDVPRPDPRIYIMDIIDKKRPIEFSSYKSRREKMMLLDCAINCSDGNLITAVTIFISKTLKQSIFLEELRKRTAALDHYLNYLDATGRSREAMEISRKL